MATQASPLELARLAADPRVQVRREGAPRLGGRCVVYWMQRAMRIDDNPALDVAIEAANALGLPVVVFFSVIPNYPNANLRHYHFMAQGLRDVEADAAARGVGFVLRRWPGNSLDAFLEETEAALVVGDENPCREPERWRAVLARRLKFPFWTVDADVVVPSAVFGKSFHLLHHFRPHLQRALPEFLVPHGNPRPAHAWKPWKKFESFDLRGDITEGFGALDRSVRPVDSFTGGAHAARKRLAAFVKDGLANYETGRNRPELVSTLLFRGLDGVLPLDLWKEEHRVLRGKLTPIFYNRAGEVLHLPQRFEEAIRKVTAAVCCVGCKHSHVGVPPVAGGWRP